MANGLPAAKLTLIHEITMRLLRREMDNPEVERANGRRSEEAKDDNGPQGASPEI
jgi:hypothetical protein